jgi:hypothetical protein
MKEPIDEAQSCESFKVLWSNRRAYSRYLSLSVPRLLLTYELVKSSCLNGGEALTFDVLMEQNVK